MSETDPRRDWAFRCRVVMARAAAGFERLWSASWPTLLVVAAFLVVSLFGVWAWLPAWLHALGLLGFAGALGWTLWRTWRTFRWPDHDTALQRLEQVNRLTHQPLRALGDRLAGGENDPATLSLWRRYQERLLSTLPGLRVGLPRSDLPKRDPWAVRAALLLLLIVGLVQAGSMMPERLIQAFELGRADAAARLPVELTLWVTPPTYTGRPPVRLEMPAPVVTADGKSAVPPPQAVALPAGSEALAQLHHLRAPVGDYALSLDKRSATFAQTGEESAEATLVIDRSGRLRVGRQGEELGAWLIEAIADRAPSIAFVEKPGATRRGVLRSHFATKDDYGVVSVALLLSRPGAEDEVERIELMRPAAGTTELDDAAYLDLTPHPWAGLPVVLRLEAVDGIEQRGQSEPIEIILPARNFQHPVARALIEQRRQLAAQPESREQVAAVLNELSKAHEYFQDDPAVFMALRSAALRLMLDREEDTVKEVMELLWDTALHLEDGNLSLAERELRELQEALRRALAEGASDAELERLMAELQRALEAYLDELLRQAQQQAADQPQQQPMPGDSDAIELQRQDFQQMMDMLREMIRTGARDAARQMLAQMQEMLENLQVAKNGQMQQGQQMLSQLQRMIQRQQELLDQTFNMTRRQGPMSQQRRPGQQQGQQQGQMSQGQQGQAGRPQGPMDGTQPGQMGMMAADQEALRRALGELMRALGEAGMPLPRALGEAELSMRASRDALQRGQPGEALDPEAQAIDQLRQGGQAMLQEMQRMYGQGQGQMPGQQFGQTTGERDPLGRSMFNQGGADLWSTRVPTELDLGHARAILEELYRRASEQRRPPQERDYLQRLLRRF